MIKLDIQERDGFLIMKDFPKNCIFNKVKTGCGATTIALTNDENYIIAVPTTELIENKCYPINDKDGKVKFWKKHERKSGLSPVVDNLFGLYGDFTIELKKKLNNYLSTTGIKKIICTYDKIAKLMEFIDAKEFKILIDEYHNLLKQYSFRDKAINGVLAHFKEFKSYCFISATPIPNNLKPAIFNDIPEYIANWNTTDEITVYPYHTNTPYMIAAKFIKTYQSKDCLNVNGVESKEAYFFINSVTEIKAILKQTQLTEDNYRIICADNPKNRRTLEGYTISSSAEAPKKFNFITSKSFEGVDFHSETGLCFVVSNVMNRHTLVSIDMDIPQIVGRIRTKANPFRNKVVHIFNTKAIDHYTTLEDMKQAVDEEVKAAQERADMLNNTKLSEAAIKQQIDEIKKVGVESYLSYQENKFVVNDMVAKLQLYSYYIATVVYQSDKSLRETYAQSGIAVTKGKWHIAPEKFVKELITKPTFRELHKQYCNIKANSMAFNLETIDIEHEHPILGRAYRKLGINTLKRLRTIKSIKAELEKLGEM